jgi:hypothetical protein
MYSTVQYSTVQYVQQITTVCTAKYHSMYSTVQQSTVHIAKHGVAQQLTLLYLHSTLHRLSLVVEVH